MRGFFLNQVLILMIEWLIYFEKYLFTPQPESMNFVGSKKQENSIDVYKNIAPEIFVFRNTETKSEQINVSIKLKINV